MQSVRFTPEDIWYGGFFELSIEVGDRSTPRINAAVNAIWRYPLLTGCYSRNDIEPEQQTISNPTAITDDEWSHSYGIAVLPNGQRLACGSCVVRETEGSDWLDFYFSMSALGTVYDVGAYPFIEANVPTPWLPEVESWLADLALWLASIIDYRMAIIGFETSGTTDARTLEADGGVPTKRYIGYVWPEQGHMTYFPSNAIATE
jgi:hypothetical protein